MNTSSREEHKLTEKDLMQIPCMSLQSFRADLARQRGVMKNILLKTWGGIGDQICAEPTLRYAFDVLKGNREDVKISLASECPEFFSHLPFKKVYNLKEHQPFWEKYFVFNTIVPPSDVSWQFVSHMVTNCVDYPSLCAFRCQLPVSYKSVRLIPPPPKFGFEEIKGKPNLVVLHPGRHWQSKTFPVYWWDSVINGLIDNNVNPVLIGGDTDDNRGTVEVSTDGTIDYRNKLSLMETVWLLQRSKVLFTNDSAPLHMAASGQAWIGFVATCKHPDYITHWRNGIWSWRMENLGKGGIWEIVDHIPRPENKGEVTAEKVDPEILESWLPSPLEVVSWIMNKLGSE